MKVEILRNGNIESSHQVHAVVANHKGEFLFKTRDSFGYFPRSGIKPLQAHLLIESGAFKAFNLNLEHLALACASHSGESIHTEKVNAWLKNLKLDNSALACGSHWPYDTKTSDELKHEGKKPTKSHNNCSGKHSGFLTACVHHGWECQGYELMEHPAQQALKKTVEKLIHEDLKIFGIDGCSIPAFQMDFFAVAKSFAKLANQAKEDSSSVAGMIFQAFSKHSELTSGTEKYCTRLMMNNDRKILVKEGAEGSLIAASPAHGISILVKAEDGADRAAQAALDSLIEKHLQMKPAQNKIIKNWAGQSVGEIRVQK